ncbi:serine-rich adhesin for platelets isoform X17 [Lucilia cuprina]|uniref:serine-rich adhesin for platelets isoform X17 n=1 Tax=Lucilia cuprina TaxID=7375 RepID=UPI001F06FCC1|nr:serine-rich adhesin for platelets isoform X17 [Lucilia cuprina]
MPNYRNKNRNRNKNKQRNKQQQQQQQQQQKQKEENCKKESKEPTTATTTTPTTINTTHSPENSTTTPTTTSSASPLTVSEVTNISAVSSENNVAEIVDTSTTKKSNQFDVCENVQSLKQTTPDVTTATEQESEANVKTTETNDTVLNEPSQCDNKSKNNHGVKTNDIMGNEKSKMIDPQRDISSEESNIQTATTDVSPISPSTCALGKVIVHRIVCEDSNSVNTNKELTTTNAIKSNESSKEEQSATPATEKSENEPFKVIIHKILTEPDVVKENEISSKELDQDNNTADSSKPTTKQTDNISQQTQQEQQQVKVIVHKVITAEEDSETTDKTDSNNTAANAQHSQQHEVKVIVHKVDKTEEVTNNNTNSSSNESASQQHEVKVIVHKVSTSDEEDHNTQQQQKQQHQHQQQAKVIVHQVHLEDKDNEPQITSPTMKEPLSSVAKTNTSDVRIVEISDESLSDLEELRSPVISEAESSVEYSDDIQKVADSITEVTSSSSSSSASSSQKQSRKQKRIALENHFLPQMLNPRFLDSISEENSELSDNSENPLSRSASNESATNCPSEGKVQKLNAKYPKSSLDFSKSHKQQQQSTNQRKSKVIREEPIAVAVAARLQDAPDADESCTTVSSCMSPEAEAAEVVFISNSASSSMSDLHDMDLFENVHTSTPDFDLDTDLRDIINKPVTENICFESLTSSAAPSAFTAKIPKQQLPEFCANQNNNNQTINNSKLINKNTPQTPYTASATATNTSIATNTTTKTRSLAETKTNSNINSKLDSILLSSSSSPANEQLVFAQIEEQISSVLSSINEVASQNTNTTIATTSTSSSSSSTKKIHTNLSNTQKLPVTTTSTTVASRTPENSCEESFNTNSSSSLCAGNNAKTSRVFSQDVNMNTVRDLIINNNNNNVNDNNTVKLNDNKLHYHKSRAYQIPQRPRDPYSTDRLQRRTNNKQTRFAAATNRRSWSESDLLQEIDKDLKLAKGFLFQDEKAPSTNMFAPKFKAKAPTGTGIWSPKNQTPTSSCSNLSEFNKSTPPTPPPPPLQPVWTPQTSPQSNRKEFRPVHFESPTLPRKYVLSTSAEPALPPWDSTNDQNVSKLPQSCTNLSATNTDTTNTSLPLGSTNSITTGLPKSSISEKIKTFERSASASDLYSRPQIKRLTDKGRPLCKPNEVIYNVKHEYMSEPETENERPRKMAQLGRRQYDGIGPITNDGMPIILRSEVKEPHQHEWYKRLYQTIHKQKHGDDCVIRYKQPRGRTQYSKPNGYQSEPEPNYDSDYSTIKYRAVNPNRLQSVSSALNVRKSNDTLYGTLPNPVKSGQNSYKNQPGRIEDYVTGHSSVSEKEKKEWWDEIMDIFNVQLDQTKLSSHYTEGNLSRALAKESGYTSDSNLVFRKKELPQSSPLSPVEQKQAYKNVQAGGEPPLFGFRKPAPEKSKDYDFPTPQLPPPPKGELLEQGAVSPNRYYESDVNIHFKTPVRQEFKYPLSEEELAIRQAEQMQKLYQEERRRKYLQELQDMNSRRHTDNFTPSQKSPIPLNRYDDFPADLAPKAANQIKSIARALYNFQAQNSKELSFKKGDIIYIKRAIDKNWYEGEHNAMIGLFPANYVEIINKETVYPVQSQAPVYRKPSEGQARAKYNFQAQSGVELSLNKGELVSLTRRVDDNWFEGRIANRKGIFPVSYVEVLTDIGAEDIAARTTTVPQTARPSLDALRTNINNEFNTLTRNGNQPPNAILRETRNAHKTDILHVDTSSEPLVYRALYKYRPQNSDELELQEGDIVHVLEKCDDGWYVGTSQRTGCFGTFPGNYVERV